MKRTIIFAMAMAIASPAAYAADTQFDGMRVGVDIGQEMTRINEEGGGIKTQDSAVGVRLGTFAEFGETFGRFYLAAQGAYDWSSATNRTNYGNGSFSTGFDHSFGLSGRMGYLVQPNLLAYVAGGWEVGRLTGGTAGATAFSDWHSGAKFGVGADYFLTGDVFTRAEASYTHYGRIDLGNGATFSPDRAQALLGIGYRF